MAAQPGVLAELVASVVEDYLAEEALHGQQSIKADGDAGGGAPLIELF